MELRDLILPYNPIRIPIPFFLIILHVTLKMAKHSTDVSCLGLGNRRHPGALGLLQCLHLPAEGGDGQVLGFVSLELPERQQGTFLVPVFISSILIVLKILSIHKLSALGLPLYGKPRSTTFYLYLF